MSVSFGRTTQNSFPSGSARTAQDSAPTCLMSARARPEREKPVNLPIAVRGQLLEQAPKAYGTSRRLEADQPPSGQVFQPGPVSPFRAAGVPAPGAGLV